MTLVPWQAGRLLVWNATCPDTFATAYQTYATQEAGKVAESAEDRKAEKYQGLPASHSFIPIAIEIMGAIGPRSMAFLKVPGHCMDSHGVRRAEVDGLFISVAICDSTNEELCFCAGNE